MPVWLPLPPSLFSPSLPPSLLPPFLGDCHVWNQRLTGNARHSPFYFVQSLWILQQKLVHGNIPATHLNASVAIFPPFFAIRSPFEILDWILAARIPHSLICLLQTICLRPQIEEPRAASVRFQRRLCGCTQVCPNRSITDMQSSFRDEVLH